MEFNYSNSSPTSVQAITYPDFPFNALPLQPQQVGNTKVIKGTTSQTRQGVKGNADNMRAGGAN